MLPVLLSALPVQNRRQIGLPTARAYVHVRRGRGLQVLHLSVGTRRVAVHRAREGVGRGLLCEDVTRQPYSMPVRTLLGDRAFHHPLFTRQRRRSRPDVELLPRAGLAHKLQYIQLRLLGLRGVGWQTVREEPLRGHRRRVARTTYTVRHQSGEHYSLRPEHRHCAHSRSRCKIRGWRGSAAFTAHVRDASCFPKNQKNLVL